MNANRSALQDFALVILPILFASVLWSQQSPQTSAVPALPADIPPTAERYSILLMGNLAGQQAVWTASDGTLHVFFQFNDRGRGPKTTCILKLDASGVPVSEIDHRQRLPEVSGRAKPTPSRPEPRAGRTPPNKGEKKISAPAYYAPQSTADPPRLLSSPTPRSRMEVKSRSSPKAKPASSA